MKKDEKTMVGGGGVVEFPASELAITTGCSFLRLPVGGGCGERFFYSCLEELYSPLIAM